MPTTIHRDDPRLRRGPDDSPVDQNEVYLVLPPGERQRGFVKPYRDSYQHTACGQVTTMGRDIAETYARDPWFYGATYCCACRKHRPLFEFRWWPDGESMLPEDWAEAELLRVRAAMDEAAKPKVFDKVLDDGAPVNDRIG